MVLTRTAATVAPGAPSPRRRRRRIVALSAGLVVAVAGVAAGLALSGSGAPGPLPASAGLTEDRPLPASVLHAPLVDEQGRPITLSAFAGHVVVLVPFLTSCQEVCPLTTAALLQTERSVARAGLAATVSVVEVSLDPGRDVPSRLAAYARLTGARWPLLTGTPAAITAFWHELGISAERVPEGSPPGIDWQTGKPYAYDVDHADGFFLLGRDLRERFLTLSAPDISGAVLPGPLAAMLDAQGRQNEVHPAGGAWTVDQLVQGIGWLTGRTVAKAG